MTDRAAVCRTSGRPVCSPPSLLPSVTPQNVPPSLKNSRGIFLELFSSQDLDSDAAQPMTVERTRGGRRKIDDPAPHVRPSIIDVDDGVIAAMADHLDHGAERQSLMGCGHGLAIEYAAAGDRLPAIAVPPAIDRGDAGFGLCGSNACAKDQRGDKNSHRSPVRLLELDLRRRRDSTRRPQPAAVDMASRQDIPSLTGLRGVAACSVLFGHALDTAFSYEPALFPFAARFAYFGMSLFFVLSGFVIHYNYADLFQTEPLKIATRQFFVARFARLYPLYAVAIFCALPMIPVPFSKWVVLSYLTMTQSWFNFEKALFAPTWSISTEWFFYFAFVPLTMVVVKIRNAATIFLAIAVLAIGGLSAANALWHDAIIAGVTHWFWHGDQISYDPQTWTIYFAPYLRILDFISGMLMAQAYRSHATDWMPPWLLPCALLWIVLVGMTSWLPRWEPLETLVPNFLYVLAIAPLMLHVSVRKSWLSRILSSPPMIFLGEISYSIYIWSFFVMTMLGGSFNGHPMTIEYVNSGIKILAICGMAVVIAYGSYALIEVPARQWIRGRLSPTRPAAAAWHHRSPDRARP
jgi:peptidoglycan/LPS O-acetylase OafA/YrhL